MKKLLLLASILGATVLSAAPEYPVVTAHRGGHIKDYIPENSIAGIASAKRFGYNAVECDPKKTSDGVIVLMHDKTINRTMRFKDGFKKIEEPVNVSDCTYEELCSKYVLFSKDPAQRQRIPTLEEFANECKRQGMKIMLHSQMIDADKMVHRILGDDWICFSSSKKVCLNMRNEGFKGLVLFSTTEKDADKVIADLNEIGGPVGISTMDKGKPQVRQLTPDYIKALREKGFEVQSSIFRSPYEVESVHDGCNMVLTDFYWYQGDGKSPATTWNAPKKAKAGETVEKEFGKLDEYGAIVVELEFKGNLDLEVNGHNYSFSHESDERELIGIRLYKSTPSVRMTAGSKVRFKKAQVKVYSL